jgi:hypothetical protein
MRFPGLSSALLVPALLVAGCGGGGGPQDLAEPADLGIDRATLVSSIEIVERQFAAIDCAVAEGTVGGPGLRRLLLFSLPVVNHGAGDVVLGDPAAPHAPLVPADFVHSTCQDRFLLANAARYELRDACGTVASAQRGLLFRDSVAYGGGPTAIYDEAFQGLSAGWGSLTDKTVEGQWVDITGVPPGTYSLVVTVNANGKVAEAGPEPGTVSVTVVVDDPPVTAAVPGTIDVTLDRDALIASLEVMDRNFDAADCAVIEGAVGGTGVRRLLLFDTVVVNYGEHDLVLGDPSAPEAPFDSADFVFSPCQGRLAFRDFARYELRAACDDTVVAGHDQALVLADRAAYLGLPSSGFSADDQGISSGWASVHGKDIEGQWIDITGLPEGDYEFSVTVNPEGKVAETTDAQRDTVKVPFRVPNPSRPVLTPDSVDVTVDRGAIVDSVEVVDRSFDAAHCAVVEGAVGGTGVRRLLRFATIVANLGEEDLVVGDPAAPEPPFVPSDFIFSPCHGHYHFEGWARYELRDASGAVVALGHKQAFCLRDNIPYLPISSEGYDCDFQGISSGWGDVYGRNLDGQWVDITGVPEGDYDLVVTINEQGKVYERADRHPNIVTVPVHVPDPGQPPP